MLLNKVSITK